ncbi:hypothetical protein WEI85_35065 [Actinomycetes bacterium KLBMP 9797]
MLLRPRHAMAAVVAVAALAVLAIALSTNDRGSAGERLVDSGPAPHAARHADRTAPPRAAAAGVPHAHGVDPVGLTLLAVDAAVLLGVLAMLAIRPAPRRRTRPTPPDPGSSRA